MFCGIFSSKLSDSKIMRVLANSCNSNSTQNVTLIRGFTLFKKRFVETLKDFFFSKFGGEFKKFFLIFKSFQSE